jgi:hypothetical protein
MTKDLRVGMRFVGSNNARLEGVNGQMVSGILLEKLPPESWDTPKDPEWIVRYDPTCGGGTKCIRESILRRFKVSTTQ